VIVGIWTSVKWEDDLIKYVAWDVLHDELVGAVQPNDALVFHLHATKWDGAHNRAREHYFYDFPILPTLLWSWPHSADDGYLSDARNTAENVERVWSSYDPRYKPDRVWKFNAEMVTMGFGDCGRVVDTPMMAVDLFVRPPAFPLHFGGDLYAGDGIGMALLGSITRERDGDVLVPLGWQQDTSVPLNTYSYAVHLTDSSGTLARQVDLGLPPVHEFSCQAVRLDTSQLTPGDYELALLVYDWQTGNRLNGVDTSSDLSGDHIRLGDITIQ
jgi:hypothetical protein